MEQPGSIMSYAKCLPASPYPPGAPAHVHRFPLATPSELSCTLCERMTNASDGTDACAAFEDTHPALARACRAFAQDNAALAAGDCSSFCAEVGRISLWLVAILTCLAPLCVVNMHNSTFCAAVVVWSWRYIVSTHTSNNHETHTAPSARGAASSGAPRMPSVAPAITVAAPAPAISAICARHHRASHPLLPATALALPEASPLHRLPAR